MESVDDLLQRFTAWAATRPDVRGLALAGSYARGEAQPDSDIDLVLISDVPQSYRDADEWLVDAPYHDRLYIRPWGRLTEHRLVKQGAPEVDLGITDPSWANQRPVDTGTATVVRAGFKILYDPERMLGPLSVALADQSSSGSRWM